MYGRVGVSQLGVGGAFSERGLAPSLSLIASVTMGESSQRPNTLLLVDWPTVIFCLQLRAGSALRMASSFELDRLTEVGEFPLL